MNRESKESAKAPRAPSRGEWIAFTAPFLAFMGFLALASFISKFAVDLGGPDTPIWLTSPEYWVYPLQTVVCLVLLAIGWRHYRWNGWRPVTATLVGVAVLGVWITPQWLLGADPRLFGFDPTLFAEDPAMYWFQVGMRFLRLVVAVPLLEEVFWRAFLMRWLINERFTAVPFGAFSWKSFLGTALLFGLAHAGPDFVVAVITGLIYNALAVWTRSLGACVLAHAVTNLILGVYIMRTGQWGFW